MAWNVQTATYGFWKYVTLQSDTFKRNMRHSSSDWKAMSPKCCSCNVGKDIVPLLTTGLHQNLPPLPFLWLYLATFLQCAYIIKPHPHPNHFFTNVDPIPLTLKMQAACSCKTSASTYNTWWRKNLKQLYFEIDKKNVYKYIISCYPCIIPEM